MEGFNCITVVHGLKNYLKGSHIDIDQEIFLSQFVDLFKTKRYRAKEMKKIE